MKIALVFISCLVALSCQQHLIWPYTFRPLPRFYPVYYSHIQQPLSIVESQEEGKQYAVNDADLVQEIQGRIRPQKKFGIFPNLLGSNVLPYASTFTSTVFVTSTSTVITATITTCLPSSHFASLGAQSATCARRKRESITIGDVQDSQTHVEDETSLRQLEELISDGKPQVQPLVSSMEEDDPTTGERTGTDPMLPRRLNRAAINVVITTTSTLTSFSFSSTVIKKTLKIVPDPIQGVAGVLTCLPSGFIVC